MDGGGENDELLALIFGFASQGGNLGRDIIPRERRRQPLFDFGKSGVLLVATRGNDENGLTLRHHGTTQVLLRT